MGQIGSATKVLSLVVAALVFTGLVAIFLRLSILTQSIPATDAFNAGFTQHLPLTLLHILPGLVFIILGPLQFIAKIRKKYLSFHRWSGRIYVVSGVLAGVSALILSIVVDFGGLTETIAVAFFSSLFLISLGFAVYRIRQRKVAAHREWMIRTFALGLAVTTMRPIFVILTALTNHPGQEILGITFWLAFSLHLIIAELWVNITRTNFSTTTIQQSTPT